MKPNTLHKNLYICEYKPTLAAVYWICSSYIVIYPIDCKKLKPIVNKLFSKNYILVIASILTQNYTTL